MKHNVQIRQEAREILRGKWLAGVVITLIFGLLMLLTGAFSVFNLNDEVIFSLLTILTAIVIGYPLQVGFAMVWLKLARTGNGPELKPLFGGFTRRYHRSAMGTLLLMQIYTLLWTLLLIVPGIIKSIEYAMTPFIIADEPELGCNEAIEKSMAMMQGHRWQLFKMYLGMIGWMILGVFTCYIAWLWIIPYYQTAYAKFYLALKEEAR
ncbi:MAG: DUF975 family protein [Rikenellaceae bacterium]|nr:DUF975 family protein [Rikenellaceae bacterium]